MLSAYLSVCPHKIYIYIHLLFWQMLFDYCCIAWRFEKIVMNCGKLFIVESV